MDDFLKPQPMPKDPATEKILIIKLGALGDVIFAEGAIRDIRHHHPHASITLLTAPFFGKLLRNHPCIDHIMVDQRKPRWHLVYLFKLMLGLRRQKFDRVYDLQNNRRTNMYHKWLMPICWSGKANWATFRYTQHSSPQKTRHDYLAEQLQLAGIKTLHTLQPNWLWLGTPVDDLLRKHQLPTPFVLLLPGCSMRHPEKRWPGYAQLARELTKQGHTVVFAPGPEEMHLIHEIPAICLLDKDKPLTIMQMVGLAPHISLVIGNDSGPTHLMACCQTRGIALFHNERYVHDSGIAKHYHVFTQHPIAHISVQAVQDAALAQLTRHTAPLTQ